MTMTQQEAEAVMARLERVWEFVPNQLTWKYDQHDAWELGWGSVFEGLINDDLSFCHWPERMLFRVISRQFETALSCSEGDLTAWRYPPNRHDMNPSPAFMSEWMPIFRRNCWLCGCPIAASAHEKAEWMQGFTREEIEIWQVKI